MEDKDLLLKDLCLRLPYGVKIQVNNKIKTLESVDTTDKVVGYDSFLASDLKEVKPYLFPLLSMTNEQKKELISLAGYEEQCEESCGFDSRGLYIDIVGHYIYEDNKEIIVLYPEMTAVNWFLKNHFDINGLIEKDSAIDATNLNIY